MELQKREISLERELMGLILDGVCELVKIIDKLPVLFFHDVFQRLPFFIGLEIKNKPFR